MAEDLICDRCKYKDSSKYAYPCASCKKSNYYKNFTPLLNDFIGQCIVCGTPYEEGDISVIQDRKAGPQSVLRCTCHNPACGHVSIYKIGTYIEKDRQ